MPRLGRSLPIKPHYRRTLAIVVPSFVTGTASFVSSGPTSISITASNATGGTAPYTYQWQRNASGGSYSNISNGGGVSGATTLTLTDGSVSSGILYGYRLVYTDNASSTVTSNAVTAQAYLGGSLTGGGGPLVGLSALVSC